MSMGSDQRGGATQPPSFDPKTWNRTSKSAPDEPGNPRLSLRWLARAIAGCSVGIALLVATVLLLWPHQRTQPPVPARLAPTTKTTAQPAPIITRLRIFRGEMDEQTFYSSAVAAGVDDRLVPEIAEAFAYDFDFVRDIHPGDVFEVAVESGGAVPKSNSAPPRLYYVSLVTAAKSNALYRFQPSPDEPAGWYDAEGRSARRNLMRTPVQGGRVTSTFGMREHPVLGFTRMHKGVDFGVPVGTPVFASGAGVIAWIGPHGDHGMYIRIDHTDHVATAYAHLSGFVPKLAVGSRIHQGDVVAFSGNTGISTGPHLHYEVIVNGQQVDPTTYKQELSAPLQSDGLKRFIKERDRIDALRLRSM
jgi:murein DD-endopeptidase MepM/ murein hydrolase activator NlpD